MLNSYPDEVLTCHDTKEDFDDIFKYSDILRMYFSDCGLDEEEQKVRVILNPRTRVKKAITYAKEHNAQIYTEVDGDDGNMYYAKGIRFCNRINQGMYTIVKVDNLKVDNS